MCYSMQLTAFTDYSLRILMYVAANEGRLSTIDGISEAYGISRNHVMKAVHSLGEHGYLQTIRGKGGGILLGRPAARINLGDVVRITESNLAVVPCFADEAEGCAIERHCVLSSVLHQALGAFLSVLDQYSLADLMRPARRLRADLGIPAPGVQT